MNVLSLCDGMSCGQIALKELGIPVEYYFASEIDKNAIKVTMDNFPGTVQLGDVTKITENVLKTLPKIHLVIFGFPCRSLSKVVIDRKEYNQGLKGISGLFYDCNNILMWIKTYNNSDVKFMVENVDSNKTEDINEISQLLGAKPHLIDSALFSAQERKRNYWTNIPIPTLPNNNPIVLENILDKNVDEKFFYSQDFDYLGDDKRVCAILNVKTHEMLKRVYNPHYKSPTLTACRGGYQQKKVYIDGRVRKLTPNEYRKLQTIPDWYKMDVTNSHIYNMCGDGWTIEVIKHIFRGLIN